jgi:hypothetical protein
MAAGAATGRSPSRDRRPALPPLRRHPREAAARHAARRYPVAVRAWRAAAAVRASLSCRGAVMALAVDVVLRLRFWAKVNYDGPLPAVRPELGRCWLWTGAQQSGGYGHFRIAPGATMLAHRFAYVERFGTVPLGLQVDHLCQTLLCVRPSHLEAVTPLENNRRSSSPSARHRRQTECKRGHPFDEVNTYRKPDGRRTCRRCHAAYQRARRGLAA